MLHRRRSPQHLSQPRSSCAPRITTMGSITSATTGPVSITPNRNSEDEIVVLVTGFRPFRAQYPINPSWEIAKALPPLLSTSTRQIRILVHPEPIRVAYSTVRELVPKLWSESPRIDFMVHVGMAGGRNFYSVERRGHRDRYLNADVDGVVLENEEVKRASRVWEECPEELLTDVDVDNVWKRWRDALPNVDIRLSEDAGRYLCDFIYYCSLVHLWRMKKEKNVVFFHVPVESDKENIRIGTEVLVELIRALVDSAEAKKIPEVTKEKTSE